MEEFLEFDIQLYNFLFRFPRLNPTSKLHDLCLNLGDYFLWVNILAPLHQFCSAHLPHVNHRCSRIKDSVILPHLSNYGFTILFADPHCLKSKGPSSNTTIALNWAIKVKNDREEVRTVLLDMFYHRRRKVVNGFEIGTHTV